MPGFKSCLIELQGYQDSIERSLEEEKEAISELVMLDKKQLVESTSVSNHLGCLLYESVEFKRRTAVDLKNEIVKFPDPDLDLAFDEPQFASFLQGLHDDPSLFRLLCPAPVLIPKVALTC